MAVLTQLSQLEDRHVPTTTLEGWRRFVESDPAMFELLSRDEWVALLDDDRTAYCARSFKMRMKASSAVSMCGCE
jgi:hypothetical protein